MEDIGIEVGFSGVQRYYSQLAAFTQRTTAAVRSVVGENSRLQQSFREASSEIPGLGRAMQLIQNPLVAGTAAIAAVGAAMGKSINEAQKFNNEFLELQNLNLDKSAKQLDDLRGSILSTSVQSGRAAGEISKAFFDVQSGTGKFGDEVSEVVGKVASFSTATKTDLTQAINGAVKGLRAYRFEVSELDGFLASQFATVQVGITTFDELNRVQVEFAGSAAAIGQGFNQANKVFAAFTATSKNAQIAATNTKAAFQDLTKGDTVQGLKNIGVAVFDVDGNVRDVDKIIADLVPKFEKMSEQEFSQLKEEIGGSEGLRGLLDAVKNGGEELISVFQQFDQATADFDINALLANAKGDFKTLSAIVKNQFNTVMIQIGQEILPQIAIKLNEISQLIPRFSQYLSENRAQIQSLWSAVINITKALAAFGGAYIAIRKSIQLYSVAQKAATIATAAYHTAAAALPAILTTVRTAWVALSTAFKANPIGLIVTGLTAAAVALATFATNADQVTDSLAGINTELDKVKQGFSDFRNSSSAALSGVDEELQRIRTGASDGANLIQQLQQQLNDVPKATESVNQGFQKLREETEQITDPEMWARMKNDIEITGGLLANDAQVVNDQAESIRDAIERIRAARDKFLKDRAAERAAADAALGLNVNSLNALEEKLKSVNADLQATAIGGKSFRLLSIEAGRLADEIARVKAEIDVLRGQGPDVSIKTQKPEDLAETDLSKIDVGDQFERIGGQFDFTNQKLETINTTAAKLRETFSSLGGQLKTLAVDSLANFAQGFGRAIALGEDFRGVLIELGKTILVEGLKYAGLALLNAASTAQPWPLALALGAAGMALLGLSGAASGMLDNAKSFQDEAGAGVDLSTQAGQSVQTGEGLGQFSAQEFGQGPIVQIFMDGEEISNRVRNRIDLESELQTG